MKRIVFDIQHFCLNDGPGIRTTVFLKGCPLACLWCHNPESKRAYPELIYRAERCLGCGACVDACGVGAHAINAEGIHILDRSSCTACGACVDACGDALEICGKAMSVDEIISELVRDRAFYNNSGGGITVSGGEPLMTPDFTLELVKRAKQEGLHTAVETSGYAKWQDIEALAEYVDLFLYDVKESDEARHREYTGVSFAPILSNLERLSELGAKILMRCPIIPGYNDREEHFAFIGELAERLDGVIGVDVMPYHPLGRDKSFQIGREYPITINTFPRDEQVASWLGAISSHTKKPTRRG
ncbi:MAG: glycyl-radical enzyme activating protein [Clostridia bacterium]|nr:glycyl-radical enzyme activating protein [Clostridia bacterium]